MAAPRDWARTEQQQARAAARGEGTRRTGLKQEGYQDTRNQMRLFGSQVPIGQISGDIVGAYKQAGQGIADVYGQAGKAISGTYSGQEAKARGDLQPWRAAGAGALGTLQQKMAAGPGEFETSPGYQFRLEQGQKAIESSAAARGGALSGRAIKEAARFGQGLASNEYQSFIDRYHQSMAPYQQMSGRGQEAAGRMGGYSMQAAPGIAEGARYGAEGVAEGLRFGAQGTERGLMAKANALTSAYSAALQTGENERGRIEGRETEQRAYDESNRLREAAALEKRRQSMNLVNSMREFGPSGSLSRTQQMPYY